MFTKMTHQEHLKNLGLNAEQVKECFNCSSVEIASDGDVWIEGPQPGHWLREHELETLTNFIEAKLGV